MLCSSLPIVLLSHYSAHSSHPISKEGQNAPIKLLRSAWFQNNMALYGLSMRASERSAHCAPLTDSDSRVKEEDVTAVSNPPPSNSGAWHVCLTLGNEHIPLHLWKLFGLSRLLASSAYLWPREVSVQSVCFHSSYVCFESIWYFFKSGRCRKHLWTYPTHSYDGSALHRPSTCLSKRLFGAKSINRKSPEQRALLNRAPDIFFNLRGHT